jgi:predicted nucleic acid-binding protein
MASIEGSTASPSVLLDANVLYAAPIADLLLRLGELDLFQPRWSGDILTEHRRTFLRLRPDLGAAKADRLVRALERAFPDARIDDYQTLIAGLSLPDPDDRHVLAAAIHGQCAIIVTANLVDFPADLIMAHGIEVSHPDTFLMQQLARQPDLVLAAARSAFRDLKSPPVAFDIYVAGLRKVGLRLFAGAVEAEQVAMTSP